MTETVLQTNLNLLPGLSCSELAYEIYPQKVSQKTRGLRHVESKGIVVWTER